MKDVQIVKVSAADITKLQQISRDSFYQAFAAANEEADMQLYMDKSFSQTRLLEELNNPLSSFYFAVQDKEVVGYLKLNWGTAQTELKESTGFEIERIYVLQAQVGKKIGQLMYEYALAMAMQMQAEYLWLAVWEHNQRAISFYQKNGLVAFDKHSFFLGNDEQTDIMMKKTLSANHD